MMFEAPEIKGTEAFRGALIAQNSPSSGLIERHRLLARFGILGILVDWTAPDGNYHPLLPVKRVAGASVG